MHVYMTTKCYVLQHKIILFYSICPSSFCLGKLGPGSVKLRVIGRIILRFYAEENIFKQVAKIVAEPHKMEYTLRIYCYHRPPCVSRSSKHNKQSNSIKLHALQNIFHSGRSFDIVEGLKEEMEA